MDIKEQIAAINKKHELVLSSKEFKDFYRRISPSITCMYDTEEIIKDNICSLNLSEQKKTEMEQFLRVEHADRKFIKDAGWTRTTNLLVLRTSKKENKLLVGYFVDYRMAVSTKLSLAIGITAATWYLLPFILGTSIPNWHTLVKYTTEILAVLGITECTIGVNFLGQLFNDDMKSKDLVEAAIAKSLADFVSYYL